MKTLFLTNGRYDLPNDAFSCDLVMTTESNILMCGTLSVSYSEANVACSIDSNLVAHDFIIAHLPVNNMLHLTALITMALHDAYGEEDSHYADTLDRGDVIVLRA